MAEENKNEPDRLSFGDESAETAAVVETADWIVRLERRDAECQFRFIDRQCNVNSRLSSAMRLNKDEARQFAKAISEQHPKYKARALLYTTMRKKQDTETK